MLGKIEEHNVNKITGVQYLHALYVETGTERPPQISKSPPGDITSVGNLWCQLGLNSKAGTIACGKGALPRGIGTLRALTAFSASLWTCILSDLHLPIYGVISLSHRHPWRLLVPAPSVNREGSASPAGSRDWAQSIPDGEAGRQWERPWVRPWEERWSGFFLKVPLHPAQPTWEERFPEYSSLPSTVWIFVWNIALNASPVLSQFTHVYSGFSIILLTVPLSKYLLSSLSERTRVSEDLRSKDLSCHPGRSRTSRRRGRPENGSGAGSQMDLHIGQQRCPRTLDLGGVSLGWD